MSIIAKNVFCINSDKIEGDGGFMTAAGRVPSHIMRIIGKVNDSLK